MTLFTGAKRSGKTYLLYYIAFFLVSLFGEARGFMIGKTLETLKENVLDPMVAIAPDSVSYRYGGKEINISGVSIRGLGANDEKARQKVQGSTGQWAIGDEVALWPESFFKMMMGSLSLPGAMLFGSLNPESPFLWLKEKWIDRAGEIDIQNFHFHIDDNDTLSPEYVANLKKEYTGVWYKRYIEGEWCVADGIIYDMFDEKKHVVNAKADYPTYAIGIDYGTNNPFVAGLWGIEGDIATMCRELYYDSQKALVQKTDSQYVDMLADFLEGIPGGNIYPDPSASSFILAMKRDDRLKRFKVINAKNDVLPGIRFVSERLNKNLLFYDKSCTETIKEKSVYSWDKKAQQRGEDKPLKENDHCSDAERYAIYSYFKKSKVLIA